MNKIRIIAFILIIIILVALIFILLSRYMGNRGGRTMTTKPTPVISQSISPTHPPGGGGGSVNSLGK